MHEFSGRTAVITGGASGIGLAVAQRLGAEGMNLVLADIEAPVLAQVVRTFEADGVTVLGIETDVSDRVSVLAMRDQTIERFGTVEFLFNNAGVAGGGALLAEADDYEDIFEWTLGVNLYGVLHCIRAFVPGMIAHGQPAHVINTASMAGLIPAPLGAYTVSKYGSLCMAELLAGECAETEVNVSVLCPAFVVTGIADSVRNLPEHLVPTVDASPEAWRPRSLSRPATNSSVFSKTREPLDEDLAAWNMRVTPWRTIILWTVFAPPDPAMQCFPRRGSMIRPG